MRHPLARRLFLVSCAFLVARAHADTASWFHSCQVATPVSSGLTSDTVRSQGYLFTYTRDKLFTGGTGQPIGRAVRVPWPSGIEAQAVTTTPPGVTDHHARLTVQRSDGQGFDFTSFSFKLLANTGGAGASIEIMPLLNGEDGLPNPVNLDATGYYGMVFSYGPSSTTLLRGFDTYQIALYVDFALIELRLESASLDPQVCCLAGAPCADLTAEACVQQGGTPLGTGTTCSCDACAATGPPPVPSGMRGSRLTGSGDSLSVIWDAASCPAPDYQVLYGDLGEVSTYALRGAACSMGTSGSAVWSLVPAGDLFFLVVGTDGSSTESSWGVDSGGQERHGTVPSGLCGITAKDAATACP